MVMEQAIDVGFEEFSEADVAFHDAVAEASRNALIQVCNSVVRGVVLSLISDKVTRARNSKALMRESLRHHHEVLEAIRAGDGPAAARISRQNLYDYYSGYLPEAGPRRRCSRCSTPTRPDLSQRASRRPSWWGEHHVPRP